MDRKRQCPGHDCSDPFLSFCVTMPQRQVEHLQLKQEEWQASATKRQQEEQKMLQDMLQQVFRTLHPSHVHSAVWCSSSIVSSSSLVQIAH